ncbi:MAG TPA: S9 family peptidase [Gemmatimonadaceae bacterium]|nr:S9 family peptidase [Gemmatimonadaceae bacterium]
MYRTRIAVAALGAFVATAPLIAQQQQQQQQQQPQQARPSNRLQLEQYLDWEDVQTPQLSPDGAQILFTRRWVDKMNDRWESSVWLMNADGTHQRALVQGSDAQWSPDGKRIAYIGKGEPTGSQIFVRWMDGEGAATQISHLTEAPTALEWSPDGKSIAFNMNVPVRDNFMRINMPQAPKGAKWIEPPKIVTRLNYRSDRVGYTDDYYRHIFVIPSDGGTARQITTGDWNYSAPAYSADGKWIAYSSLREPNAEMAYRKSNIYATNVETNEVKQLTHRNGTSGQPLYSPDGRTIAFISADSGDHSAWAESKLYFMNADGSNLHLVSGTLDRPISGVIWAPDNSGVYFNVESEGSKNLYFASPAGQFHPVTTGKQVLTVAGIARSGLAVGVRTTPVKPNDVVTFTVPKTGSTSTFNQLTAVNDDVLAGKELAQTEEIWYTSKDGLKIQGWVVKPAGFDPSKKYPLILDIHGGPQSMYNVGFSFPRQDHAANGYIVLYTNPRGSTGYGEKFTNEIKNAYPGKDFDDLMAGVDTVVGRGYIDTKNMFVYGCSGGGVLTSWTVGHTDRFAAAAALCPVIDWISFVGETDGAGWYGNFEKPFWEDPSEYLRRSPIMYVGHVKTPTLLMTGVLDLRTPIPQIEEFYRALKMRGVPTAMIRMNNEYHGTSSTPSNFLRTQLYVRGWFEKYGTYKGQQAVTTTF